MSRGAVAAFAATLAWASACGHGGEDLFSYRPDGDAGIGGGGPSSSGSDTSTSSSDSVSSVSSSSSAQSSSASVSSSSGGPICPNGVCEPGESFGNCPQDCAGCGDGQCAGETCDDCPQDCGQCACGDQDCNGFETCESCPGDCGACPPEATCPHTVCFVGEALNGTDCHDTCVTEVCAQDPSCCEGNGGGWDDSCQALQATLCGVPDPCMVAVCAQIPSCCEDTAGGSGGAGGGVTTIPAWTQACVDAAKMLCGTQCNCQHSVCGTGGDLDPSCNPCAAAVCEADSYCCTNQWDGLCAEKAMTVCGIDCM